MRRARFATFVALNCSFWVVLTILSWTRAIPPAWAPSELIAIGVFGLPFASCCGWELAVFAELHDLLVWQVVVSAFILFANSFVWAYGLERLCRRLEGPRSGPGFPVDRDHQPPPPPA